MSSKRRRTKPLTPKPFKDVTISRLPPWSLKPDFAQEYCKFCPSLDIPHYRNGLSKEKHQDLDTRTSKLRKRAIQNHMFNASEFNWEADAWRYVFGLIRDDDTFRMDKRPYEFIEKVVDKTLSVRRRIPDATMGLRTYNESDLEHGYTCDVVDCKINHDSMQPNETLLDFRIEAQMYDRECGLIVDGIWGESNLIFPFAVYEAKKSATTWEQAEDQIHHAFRVYLAMLDDLARRPTNVSEYQTKESARYQMFGFTSCGPYWKVYVAHNFLNNCQVETIWEGDIKNFSRAFELICIVDQIHHFAANQHREFVVEHLEPWLEHAEKREIDLLMEFVALQPDRFPDVPVDPQWLKMKDASKQARNSRVSKTRLQNKLLAQRNARIAQSRVSPLKGMTIEDSSTARLQSLRSRGRRPNKPDSPQPKRPRGRPKKCEKQQASDSV